MEYTNREIFAGFLNRIVVIGKICIRSEITTRIFFFLVLANFFTPWQLILSIKKLFDFKKKPQKVFVMYGLFSLLAMI